VTHRCQGCASKTTAAGDFCRTCQRVRRAAYRRIKAEGLTTGQAGGSWWIWDPKGNVIVGGKASHSETLQALAVGDEIEEESLD